MLLQLSQFFPFAPLHLVHAFPPAIPPPLFMPMGHACKFIGYFTIYTVPNIPCLFCIHQFVLSNPCIFPSISLFPLPTENSPNDLGIYDSVPVLVV